MLVRKIWVQEKNNLLKIESQTSLSEDEIQAKIAEAENFAEEDKQEKGEGRIEKYG